MEAENSYVTFVIDDFLLGVEIARVREIHRLQEVTPVPRLPGAVRGLLNLRGQLVTLLDLRLILMGEPTVLTNHTVNVIIDADGEPIGLTADRLEDVVSVSGDAVDPLPSHMNNQEARYYQGVIQRDDDLLILLDIDTVIDPESLGPTKTGS